MSKNTVIFSVLSFGLGVVVTYFYMKHKYELEVIPAEDILNNAEKNFKKVGEASKQAANSLKKFTSSIKPGYESIAKRYSPVEEKTEDILVIEEDEFGENEEYDQTTMTFYSDGYLVGSNGSSIKDPEEIVGPNIESYFDGTDDDVLYIRNDKLKAYVEVVYDQDKYVPDIEETASD